MQFSEEFKEKVLLVIFSILAYYLLKPSITFKPSGRPREYGFGIDSEGYKKTVYTMQNIIILIVILLWIL
jgi:hypothetical protein